MPSSRPMLAASEAALGPHRTRRRRSRVDRRRLPPGPNLAPGPGSSRRLGWTGRMDLPVDTSGMPGRFRAMMGSIARTRAREDDTVTALDYTRFEALTFDCYGTLIDWEAGILAGLRRAVARRGIDASDDELLESYARYEAE